MFDPVSYELGKRYTETAFKYIGLLVDEVDFTTVFDFAESIAQGGARVTKQYADGASALEKFKYGLVKIKISFNGIIAEKVVNAQDFGTYCQFVDFAINDGHLLYLSAVVTPSSVMFECKEIQTQSYIPS